MICLNDRNLYIKSCLLRSWGRRSSLFGSNSELIKNRFGKKLVEFIMIKNLFLMKSDIILNPQKGAAYGLEQLKRLKNNIKKRRDNFKIHNKFFFKNLLYSENQIIKKYKYCIACLSNKHQTK